MREVIVVGLSHQSAELELREQAVVAFRHEPSPWQLHAEGVVDELVWLTTCNRLEAHASTQQPERAIASLKALFRRWLKVQRDDLLYVHEGSAAVEHVFRVATSLESMVIGEPQILGQVKEAYAQASEHKALHSLLARCAQRAFFVAKRVRTETTLAQGQVSISSVACELAEKIFGDLEDKQTLLVGAGKMGENAARHLLGRGAKLTVVNRSIERAQAIAQACQGKVMPWEQLEDALAQSDVAITSTASPTFVVTRPMMQSIIKQRRHRPLFIIDIALPRNVDPKVDDLDNIYHYDIDDLQQVAQEHLERRKQAAVMASDLVNQEVQAFEQWRTSQALAQTILALRQHTKTTVEQELTRLIGRIGTGVDAAQVAESISNKILHQPLSQLKVDYAGPDKDRYLAAIQRLFGIEVGPANDEAIKPDSQKPSGNDHDSNEKL